MASGPRPRRWRERSEWKDAATASMALTFTWIGLQLHTRQRGSGWNDSGFTFLLTGNGLRHAEVVMATPWAGTPRITS